MKKLLFIIAFIAAGCSEEEIKTNKGCQTGIVKNDPTNTRSFIRCCTQAEALAGNNVAAGGTASFIYYNAVTWEKCSDCK